MSRLLDPRNTHPTKPGIRWALSVEALAQGQKTGKLIMENSTRGALERRVNTQVMATLNMLALDDAEEALDDLVAAEGDLIAEIVREFTASAAGIAAAE